MMENPWRDLPTSPPYVLPSDRPYVEAFNGRLRPDEAKYRLDLRLIPAPFMGNPEARLVLLLLNPNVAPGDLEAHADPDFAATLRANIQGDPGSRAAVGLLERFRDTPAGEYWRKTFKAVLQHVESSDDLARRVLIVEFHAYRSRNYRRIRLPSQRYGFDLVRAAVRRNATIVILRGERDWRSEVLELRSYQNVVRLSSHRNSALSRGNCGPEGFQQVLAAVGRAASPPGDDWHTQPRAATGVGSISGNRAGLRRGASRGDRYVEFWSQLLERVQREHPDWPRDKPHSKNDVDMQSPLSGTLISCGFAQNNRLRHELYIDSGDAGRNMEIFNYLRQRRGELEAAYGGRLQWEPLPTRRACRIADYKEGCAIEQRERFDEYVEWFVDAGERLRMALAAVGSPG